MNINLKIYYNLSPISAADREQPDTLVNTS